MIRKPRNALFATSTEKLCKQTIKKKLLPILRETHETRRWLPDSDRKIMGTRVDLSVATIYGGWSGSPTTFADIDPGILHLNEVDKFSSDESDEGDSMDLALERGIERVDRKLIGESTPTLTGVSRVNRRVVSGWNCRYHVPCPHCGHHQALRINETDDRSNGGLWWKRIDGRHPTATIAAETACYVCEKCHEDIYDESKRWMVRRGVWVPEGQYANDDGKVLGKMANPGPFATYQMSRIYAPTFTFADIARKYVNVQGDLKAEQNFANSWKGETFTLRHRIGDWDEIARKMCVPTYKTGECHPDVVFVTAAADVQADHLVYEVAGWAQQGVGWEICHGTCLDWWELLEVFQREWPHPKGGTERACMCLIDSRHRTDEVKEFCRQFSEQGAYIWPLEGQKSGTMMGRSYRRAPIDETDDSKPVGHGIPRLSMVKVNTGEYQNWLDSAILRRKPGDPFAFGFPSDAIDDEDFFSQLTNEVRDEKKGLWVPVRQWEPWDFRDTTRYVKVAADVSINNAWNRLLPRVVPVEFRQATETVKSGEVPREPQHPDKGGAQTKWIKRTMKLRT
jgi:phage terminase large subunit GpA-like protein